MTEKIKHTPMNKWFIITPILCTIVLMSVSHHLWSDKPELYWQKQIDNAILVGFFFGITLFTLFYLLGMIGNYYGLPKPKDPNCYCGCHKILHLKGECGICYRSNCGWTKEQTSLLRGDVGKK